MNAIQIRMALTRAALGVIALGTFAGTAWGQAADDPSPCASVTDNKSRLQCYDAQEAMKARRRGAGVTGSSGPASTPSPSPAAAAVPAVVPPPAPASAAAQAPVGTTAPSSGTAAAPSSEFGLRGDALAKKRAAEAPKDAPAQSERLVAKVKAVTGRGNGDYRFELDNGQLWMESQRTGGEPPAAGETVTIRPGMLGSYFLERDVGGLALRVKRVK